MGRHTIFSKNDIEILSKFNPNSNNFKIVLQGLLDSRKLSVSEKTKSRLRDTVARAQGRDPKCDRKLGRRTVLDKQEILPELMKIKLESEDINNDMKCFIKEKFKDQAGKSPNRRTLSLAIKQYSKDIDDIQTLMSLQEPFIPTTGAKINKKVSKGKSQRSNPTTGSENDEKDQEPFIPTTGAKINKKVSKGKSQRSNPTTGSENDEKDKEVSPPPKKRKRVKEILTDGKSRWSTPTTGSENDEKDKEVSPPPKKRKRVKEIHSPATGAKVNTSPFTSPAGLQELQFSEVIGTKECRRGRYRETIRTARVLLSSGYQPEPVGRDSYIVSIINVLKNSLQAIERGKIEKAGINQSVDEDLEDDSVAELRNLYICGSPGLGKTLSIEKALEIMQKDENVSSTFKLVRLQGTTVQNTDEFYSVLASRLELGIRICKSSKARSEVLSHFTSPRGFAACQNREPTTILFIDEIDRAPIAAVKEVLEIVGEASRQSVEEVENDWVKAGPYNCNVIVIGAANNRLFCENIGISYSSQRLIFRRCFEHYKIEQLFDILKQRTEGLFGDCALKLISAKISTGDGDVRFLLQMADLCLHATVHKLRRMVERKKESNILFDDPIPLENWDEVTDIIPIVLMKHVASAVKEAGIGPSGEIKKVGNLSDGARALLIAIICYGKTDVTSCYNVLGLTIREMREALITYVEIKRQSGLIIGHDPSETNVNRWVDELRCAAMIEGRPKSLMGCRACDLDKVKLKFLLGIF